MLLQGICLSVIGICIVFTFLALLVGIMTVSSKVIPRFNHLLPDGVPQAKRPTPQPADMGDEAVAVAIAAAAMRQRQ